MAEPWDGLRATFPTNTEGLITASTMVNQVNVLEGEDADNVKSVDLEAAMQPILESLFVPFWKGVWENGTYNKGDLVFDDGWLMIANKTTTERAAPQPSGDPEVSYPSTPPWTTPYDTFAGVVWTGMIYSFTKAGWLSEVAVYVPELTDDTYYRFLFIKFDNDGNILEANTLEEPVLRADEWTTLAVGSRLILPGENWGIVIDALNSGSSTPVTGGWNYQGTGGGGPTTSGWNTNPGRSILRIDKTDLDTTDRTTELLGMVPGTVVQFTNTLAPTNSETYSIDTQPTDNGTFISWGVSLQSISGSLPIGEPATMDAEVPVPLDTKYVEAPAYYPGTPAPTFAMVQGYKRLNGEVQPGTENYAYGMVIKFQEASASDDWEVLAASETGGSNTFSPTYDFQKVTGFTVPSDVYSEVTRLTTPDRAAGTYELKFSWTSTYDSATTSQYYRYTIDDGVTWTEFIIEPSDVTNKFPFTYFYPLSHGGGTFEVIFQARKETQAANHEIAFLDIIFERKP